MKAVVFYGVGDVRLEDVPEPQIQEPTDAIVEIIASAICRTDLHLISGKVPGMKPGTILGHEGVGIVADVGPEVRNYRRGDRVVVVPTIACGNCSYCRDGYFAQCDHSNPLGRRAGVAMFGGPKSSGGIDGLQAEFARVPFANVGLVKLPDHVTNDQAILLSDMFPTGYFGAELAEIVPGDVVAVFGCGPIGQFTIHSAFLRGASRVLAVDNVQTRLEMARDQGAEVIDFNETSPIRALLELTQGIGPDRAIDAVGVDAHGPPLGSETDVDEDRFAHIERQRSQVCADPVTGEHRSTLVEAPTQALTWAIESIAKSGTLAIIGIYPPRFESFPLGMAFERNLTVKMGVCHHRRYIPKLVQIVESGAFDPTQIVPKQPTFLSATADWDSLELSAGDWRQAHLTPSG